VQGQVRAVHRGEWVGGQLDRRKGWLAPVCGGGGGESAVQMGVRVIACSSMHAFAIDKLSSCALLTPHATPARTPSTVRDSVWLDRSRHHSAAAG